MNKIGIIGGGISDLTAAFLLKVIVMKCVKIAYRET